MNNEEARKALRKVELMVYPQKGWFHMLIFNQFEREHPVRAIIEGRDGSLTSVNYEYVNFVDEFSER